MKKTAKLLTLAVALFAGLSGTAQAEGSSKAEGFKLGVDVVSSYVWRGVGLSDAPAIQPALSYTFPGIGVVVGAWGTSGLSEDTTLDHATNAVKHSGRYQETDLYVTVPVGPVNVTLTDYYVPYSIDLGTTSRAFDLTNRGPNTIELSASYGYNDFDFLGALNIAGNTYSNAVYLEGGYKFYSKEKYTAKAVIGAGNKNEYSVKYALDAANTGFTLVNLGVSVAKENYSAAYIYNPVDEKSNLVFSASF